MPFQHTFRDLYTDLPVFVSQRLLCLYFRLTAVHAASKIAETGENSGRRRRCGSAARRSELVNHAVKDRALCSLVYPRLQ